MTTSKIIQPNFAVRLSLLVVLLCFNWGQPTFGEDEPRPPAIGDKAPAWVDLPGTDDKVHSLESLRSKDVVVVCFTCNSCPYASDYEDRLIALQTKFVKEGLSAQLVAINANTVPADRMDKMKERAAQKKFNFPYLWDGSQTVAKAYDAIYTPEFYVLNKDRVIIYRGALDDATVADKVQVKYVELAVAAGLMGVRPEIEKAGARGCGIRFNRTRR